MSENDLISVTILLGPWLTSVWLKFRQLKVEEHRNLNDTQKINIEHRKLEIEERRLVCDQQLPVPSVV